MTALDRLLVRLRFAALAIPFGLLLWLPSASVPITIILAGLMAAYNGIALLAIRRQAALRFSRPMAVLLLVLDHAVISGLGAAVRAMNTEIRGTRRRLDQTEQLRNVLGELVGQLDVSRMLNTVIRCGMELLQMDSGAIVLLDEDRSVFTLRAAVRL